MTVIEWFIVRQQFQVYCGFICDMCVCVGAEEMYSYGFQQINYIRRDKIASNEILVTIKRKILINNASSYLNILVCKEQPCDWGLLRLDMRCSDSFCMGMRMEGVKQQCLVNYNAIRAILGMVNAISNISTGDVHFDKIYHKYH